MFSPARRHLRRTSLASLSPRSLLAPSPSPSPHPLSSSSLLATTVVLKAQSRVGTDGCCRVRHRRVRRTWSGRPTRTLPSSAASRARPWLIVSSRRELPEKGVATCLATCLATMVADPGAPPPDPLPQLGVCTISFPFLIRFDDWSAGCVPWSLSWSDARLSTQSVRNHSGQFVSAANAGSYLLQCSFLLLVGKDLFHLFVTRGGRIWCCKCDQRIWCYKCDQYQLWMHYPDYYCSQEY